MLSFWLLCASPVAAAAATIEATSTAPSCDWLDPGCWALDPALPTPIAPHNDGTNLFTVRIGDAAAPGAVDLTGAATVDSVDIATGSSLHLLDGGALTVFIDAARPGSGSVRNDGTLVIGSTHAGARLLGLNSTWNYPHIAISGTGTIELSDRTDNEIGLAHDTLGAVFEIGEGQVVRGAGTLESVINRGTIEATGVNPLVFSGTNRGVLRALGPGGISQTIYGDIRNEGLIEVEAGSRLGPEYYAFLYNFGTLRIRGAGSEVKSTVDTGGLIEILEGGSLSGPLSVDYGGVVRVGHGSTLAGGEFENGTLRLEDGLVTGPLEFGGQLAFGGARLEGIGTVHDLSLQKSRLATGLDGVGRIDVDGNATFLDDSVWEIDVAGTDPDTHDRLTVSGTASFAAPSRFGLGSRIDLAVLPGFTADPGGHLDVLSASSITASSIPLRSLFTAQDLPGDLYFAPEVVSEGSEQRLRLHVFEPIAATWTGGNGDYRDAASWSFSRPPTTAAIPDGTALDVFDARIGGASTPDSTVSLGGRVVLHRLRVDAGDALVFTPAARLFLEKPLGRSEKREVWNDGTIELSGSSLTSENGLAFRGTGTLALADDPSNYVGATTRAPVDIENGPGHTIAGAGWLGTTTLTSTFSDRGVFSNAGVVEAVGTNSLLLDAHVENEGSLIATGTGGIRIGRDLAQRGLVRIAPGSRLELTRYQDFVQDTGAAVTELGPGAVLAAHGGVLVSAGRIALDGGTIDVGANTQSGVAITAAGLLEGNGTVLNGGLSASAGGTIAPGLSGIGQLEPYSLFIGSGGLLEIELAGTAPELHDRIVSTGATLSGRVSVQLRDGFTPAHGDAFELIHASFINGTPSLEGPALGDGLFLVPELRQSNTQSVDFLLRTKREITATWAGPSGDYSSPQSWSFSVAPNSASTPANDDFDLFDVEIGQNGPVAAALASTIKIDSLSLADGSSLELGAGAALTVLRTPGRPHSGRIENDGVIRIGSDSASASLTPEGDFEIGGFGEIEISASSILRSSGRLTIGADQTLRGAGRITSPAYLDNHGVIEATGTSPLSIGPFENHGTLRAIGTGGISASIGTNRGLIESAPGSSIRGSLDNAGRIDIQAGGSFTGGLGQRSEGAVTHVAGNLASTPFAGFSFEQGLLDLDGGSISIGRTGLSIGPAARFAGAGAVRTHAAPFTGSVDIHGTMAPGRDGIGAIDVQTTFALWHTGTLSLELAGTGSHDLVTVLGTAFLNGTIDVDLIATAPGQALFAPAAGDVFDVLIAQAINDTGLSYDLPSLAAGLAWQTGVVQDGGLSRLRLLVLPVPEPSAALLLLFGLAALARSRRRYAVIPPSITNSAPVA